MGPGRQTEEKAKEMARGEVLHAGWLAARPRWAAGLAWEEEGKGLPF